jgi:hypothetical protein
MPETEPVVVKVRALTDMVSAVPHMLGFQPAESLVAVSLRGRRLRMSLTVRLDLPDSAEAFDEVVRRTTLAMAKDRAGAVLLFVFTDEPPGDRGMPYADLVDAVEDRLSAPLRDAMLVADARVWSYRCDDPDCCPTDGMPLDPTSPGAMQLSAASALQGRAVLPDRASAVAGVRAIGGLTAVSMHQAAARMAGRFAELERDLLSAEVRALWGVLVERYREPPAAVTHDEAAAITLGLHDVGVRDELVEQIDHRDDVHERLLLDVARLAQPPADAPVCTVLACAAYLAGNGVVAGAALERALATDPAYGLARLLDDALLNQIHPKLLRRALAGDGS